MPRPTLSCRRRALIDQMVLRLARKSAPFDSELDLMVKAYDDAEASMKLDALVDFVVVDLDQKIAMEESRDGQSVPPEPSWIRRLFSGGN